jgi:CDP-glucose 4,6-dehydratase
LSGLAKHLFPNISQLGRPILVTGHTGFVGSWLISVLDELQIPWVGLSKYPLEGSMFEKLNFTSRREQEFGDLRNRKLLEKFILGKNPSAILHLAADALVLEAINSPYSVMHNNFNSTLSLISEYEKTTHIKRMLVSSTDKVYKNLNSKITYIETDPLEGSEPYSESKVATEALIRAFNALLPTHRKILIARAGNIIGGGDFAKDRLIPDIVRGRIYCSKINLRLPEATRPWQHVLDVVFGYLFYLEKSFVLDSVPPAINFASFNSSKSVRYIVDRMLKQGFIGEDLINNFSELTTEIPQLEKQILDLDPSLAKKELRWENIYDVDTAVDMTIKWWLDNLEDKQDPKIVTTSQIQNYILKVIDKHSIQSHKLDNGYNRS